MQGPCYPTPEDDSTEARIEKVEDIIYYGDDAAREAAALYVLGIGPDPRGRVEAKRAELVGHINRAVLSGDEAAQATLGDWLLALALL